MSSNIPILSNPVADWLRSKPEGVQEFIIELDRPKRTVHVKRIDQGRVLFPDVTTENTSPETIDIEKIGDSVRKITHRDAVRLHNLGAIVFRANANELDDITSIPGIKRIRFNRRRYPERVIP